jgi:hypothetical protein
MGQGNRSGHGRTLVLERDADYLMLRRWFLD